MRRRIDQYLADEGLCESREKAKRAVLAGSVRINGQRAQKASDWVRPNDEVQLIRPEKYVSRGGLKLEHGLKHFQLPVPDAIAVDLGASTGGFTDCLLQQGAAQVYAVDVGKGQLAWKLRQDPRVIVMEGVNARHLDRHQLPKPFSGADLVVIDCSFISLRKVLPTAAVLLKPKGHIIALIKPQFEAGKAAADEGRGVIKDPKIHQQVVDQLQTFAKEEMDLHWQGVTESPILGPAGNKEFLCWIQSNDAFHTAHRSDSQSGQASLEDQLEEGSNVDSSRSTDAGHPPA